MSLRAPPMYEKRKKKRKKKKGHLCFFNDNVSYHQLSCTTHTFNILFGTSHVRG